MGNFRKPKSSKSRNTNLNIRLEDELLNLFDEFAKKARLSKSFIMRELLLSLLNGEIELSESTFKPFNAVKTNK